MIAGFGVLRFPNVTLSPTGPQVLVEEFDALPDVEVGSTPIRPRGPIAGLGDDTGSGREEP